MYVELIGNGLFNPFVLEYAPKPQRIRHITARLGKIPALIEQAKQNLADSPEIWTTVAIDENQGNIDLLDKEVRAGVPSDLTFRIRPGSKSPLSTLCVDSRIFSRTISRGGRRETGGSVRNCTSRNSATLSRPIASRTTRWPKPRRI